MMKKWIALALALVLLLSVTACGGKVTPKDPADTTTVTTTTTTQDVSDDTTTAVDHDCTTTTADTTTGQKVTTTKKPTTTTVYVPDGVTVPIGTRPPTTTTTTKKPTTTTTVTGGTPSGNGATTSAPATTTTTTTTTVAKPTEPPTNQRYIVLPEIGSDIDVTKKKDRIRVSAAYAWFNEDGTIGVSLTFKNHTNNWITEETDYVQYTCYDENGKVVQKATKIMLGVIDTKKYPVKTFEFNVPANTAEVRLTKSQITYWTEWS